MEVIGFLGWASATLFSNFLLSAIKVFIAVTVFLEQFSLMSSKAVAREWSIMVLLLELKLVEEFKPLRVNSLPFVLFGGSSISLSKQSKDCD